MRDEWFAELRCVGTRFEQHVPMNAYVVALLPQDVYGLEELARTSTAIQFVDEYQPQYRLSEELRRAASEHQGTSFTATIQLVDLPGARVLARRIYDVAFEHRQAYVVGPYLNLQVGLPARDGGARGRAARARAAQALDRLALPVGGARDPGDRLHRPARSPARLSSCPRESRSVQRSQRSNSAWMRRYSSSQLEGSTNEWASAG